MSLLEQILAVLKAILERLSGTPPQPTTTTTAPPATTTTTAPATTTTAAPMQPITAQTPFRAIPPLGEARLCEILKGYPLAGECRAIHAALGGRPLPVAQAWMESRYGQDANAQSTNNPLGLLSRPGRRGPIKSIPLGGGGSIDLLMFDAWADAFAEWAYRIDTPDYKDGVYQPHDMTLGQFIRVYVAGPGPDYANGESAESVARYLDETVKRLNRYYGIEETPTTPAPGTIVLGRVPPPANYAERIIAPDGVNTAFTRVNARIPRGIVLHRMIGTLTGTDHYFRNEARHRALTDFGIGKGQVYRWTQPGAAIAPFASGASHVQFSVPSGDGVRFVERYGWRQNADCESIEIEGLRYTDPVPAADYQRLVELVAWRADAWLRVPWHVWPRNADGEHALFWHNEFQNEKECPGSVVMGLTDQLIRDVAARLRQYQEAA